MIIIYYNYYSKTEGYCILNASCNIISMQDANSRLSIIMTSFTGFTS